MLYFNTPSRSSKTKTMGRIIAIGVMAELIYPYLPFLSFAIYNSPMTKAPHSNTLDRINE
jgi:hypothetical protein